MGPKAVLASVLTFSYWPWGGRALGIVTASKPLAFTLLILKHYYVAQWLDGESLEEELGNVFEARLIRARAGCEEVDEALFSGLEKKCFHFSIAQQTENGRDGSTWI